MESQPIDALRPEFDAATGHVVVEAPTGSGKSTRLPLWCAEGGRTLVVEPRRIAARSLARHVAALAGVEPGEGIGWAVRFDSRYRDDSAAIFATPGVALRWLAADGLAGFATVVLDEFHERRWDTDLLLALLRHHGGHRLVVTSATLAGAALAEYLGATRLQAEGRQFPVETTYAGEPELPTTRGLAERVAAAVRRDLARTDDRGDRLVFLPGRGEIRAAAEALGGLEAEVIELHAGTDSAIQDRALTAADRPRVILATNVAETSLTLPGVTSVIDAGLERRTHHRGGRSVLGLHAISQAAADQRAGRAGRLRPGRCLRLWSRSARLEAHTPPEVAREELDDLLLAAAAAGLPARELAFPDPLPAHAVERAETRLTAMGALDPGGHLTDHGRRLFPLPLDPLFAHLITAMPDPATTAAMADLAAALTAGPNLLGPLKGEEQRQTLLEWAPEPDDAATLIRLVRADPPRPVPLRQGTVKEARRLADDIRAALDLPARTAEAPPLAAMLSAAVAAAPELGFVRRLKRRQALGNGAEEVVVAEESRLPDEAEAAVVLDQHAVPGRGTNETVNRATCASPVEPATLAAAGVGETEVADAEWDGERITVTRRQTLAGRTLASAAVEPEGAALRQAAADLILAGRLFPGTGEAVSEAIEAWNLYLHLGWGEGEPAPEPAIWLAGRLAELGVEIGEDLMLLEPADLAFEGVPSWQRQRFDEHYPRRLSLEGAEARVHYDLRRRRIRVEKTAGRRRTIPGRGELPAWPGWRIEYQDGSRVVDIG
ncbi:MAG: helicase-related protein [Thiohalospira sp.]